MKNKTLRSTLDDLQDGEHLYIYDPIAPIGIRRTGKYLEEINPINMFRGWEHIKELGYLKKFKDTPFRVFKNSDEFWLEFRHDYLEPKLEDVILGESEVNYRQIQDEVDESSGQAVIDSYQYQGCYFVGATYSADDFYWLYWNPVKRNFRYSSCVGPIEKLDPLKTLDVEQIRNLREDIKYIHDAPLPSDLLLSPLG